MKKNVLKIVGATAIMLLGLTGCGSKQGDASIVSKDAVFNTEAYMNEYQSVDKGYSEEYFESDAAAGAVEQEEGYYDVDVTNEAVTQSGLDNIRKENEGAKLIRTVNLSINTEHFDDSVKLVEDKVDALGGYIEYSELYDYSYGRNQTIVIRIPYDKVDLFLDGVDAYGTIGHKSDNTEDVTLQYSDTESRIESLETQHKRLLELLEQAEDLENIIILNDRLTEVEWELDSYKKQIRNYDNLVRYSTISIDISEKEYIAPVEDETLWSRITSGFSNTMHNLGVFFSDLLVWLLASSPILVLLAIIVVLHIIIIKAIIRSCKKRNAKKAAAKLEEKEKQSIKNENNSSEQTDENEV